MDPRPDDNAPVDDDVESEPIYTPANIIHAVAVYVYTLIISCILEGFLSGALVGTWILVCAYAGERTNRNPRLFGVLSVAILRNPEAVQKIGLAVLRAFHTCANDLGALLLVSPLFFWWQREGRVPSYRSLAAWDALAFCINTWFKHWAGARADGLLAALRDLACVESGSLLDIVGLYALLLCIVHEFRVYFTQRQRRVHVQARVDEVSDDDFRSRSVWRHKARFLAWAFLVRCMINVYWQLVSNIADSLDCWYDQNGFLPLIGLPAPLRSLPRYLVLIGLGWVVQGGCVGWIVRIVHILICPEDNDDEKKGHGDDENGDDDQDEDDGEDDDNDEDEEDEDEDDEEDDDDDDEDGDGRYLIVVGQSWAILRTWMHWTARMMRILIYPDRDEDDDEADEGDQDLLVHLRVTQ
ncbi:hypothetical protein EsH8_III_000992 [Colletotrichum jinshuiense]